MFNNKCDKYECPDDEHSKVPCFEPVICTGKIYMYHKTIILMSVHVALHMFKEKALLILFTWNSYVCAIYYSSSIIRKSIENYTNFRG